MPPMENLKTAMPVWRLRRGLDRRFRAGHPWVYSNELAESPKGIEPGALVELQDPSGKFLARGYGNPHSLISFRTLTRNPELRNLDDVSTLAQVLKKAGDLRVATGMSEASHRLCFGEADGLPGWIIDRYRTGSKGVDSGQVFVVQAHSAGANRFIPKIEEILKSYLGAMGEGDTWAKTSIVIRNDVGVRKLEGLTEEEPCILKSVPRVNLSESKIWVNAVLGGEPIPFHVDLLKGQKTGFFLDQFSNIQLAALRFKRPSKKIRILDLCCYVGQWGTQLTRVFKGLGAEVEVVAVDASLPVLDLASRNVEAQGAHCEIWKADVLKDLSQVEAQSFDLVISDPPAFIKGRKDIPTGTHAYLQLATQVFRIVKKGGGVVTCSCSALLEEEEFTRVLYKGAQRNQVQVRWIGRGAQSPDHPMLGEFPEGRYLKSWMGFAGQS